MTRLKILTRLIIGITLCWLLKRISWFVSLFLSLGFVAKMSLFWSFVAHSIWHVKTKEYEKMCTSSMPYIAVYNNKKRVQISAQMKRCVLQACHVQLCVFEIKNDEKKWWKKNDAQSSALNKRSMLQACQTEKKYATSMPHANKNWKWSTRITLETVAHPVLKICLTVWLFTFWWLLFVVI